MYKGDFSDFNEREVEEVVVNGINWEEICMLPSNDANVSFKSFYHSINFHLDEMAPYKKVTQKEFRLMLKPWITKDILRSCDERDSLLNDIRLESDPVKIESLHVEYKLLRHKITQAKRNSKKSHYVSYFENNKMKSSDIWRGIRSLVNIKPSKTSNIKLMDENENLISDPRKIANIFNDHFATIGSNGQQKLPIERKSLLNEENPY